MSLALCIMQAKCYTMLQASFTRTATASLMTSSASLPNTTARLVSSHISLVMNSRSFKVRMMLDHQHPDLSYSAAYTSSNDFGQAKNTTCITNMEFAHLANLSIYTSIICCLAGMHLFLSWPLLLQCRPAHRLATCSDKVSLLEPMPASWNI